MVSNIAAYIMMIENTSMTKRKHTRGNQWLKKDDSKDDVPEWTNLSDLYCPKMEEFVAVANIVLLCTNHLCKQTADFNIYIGQNHIYLFLHTLEH